MVTSFAHHSSLPPGMKLWYLDSERSVRLLLRITRARDLKARNARLF